VDTERAEIVAYSLSGYLAVLAGVVMSAQSLSGDPTVGNEMILPSFAAVVLGGSSLAGGVGTAPGSIAGAIVLSYLTSLTLAFGLQAQWAQIFQGLLLVSSVSLQFGIRLLFGGRARE
jgi:ribose transport system permease protein